MLLGILPKVRDQIYVIENARPLKKKKWYKLQIVSLFKVCNVTWNVFRYCVYLTEYILNNTIQDILCYSLFLPWDSRARYRTAKYVLKICNFWIRKFSSRENLFLMY